MPITFGLFLLFKRLNYGRAALGLIVVASLVFYGWWDARYLGLLLTSILINYVIGERLVTRGPNRALLCLGLAGNLLCLAWFKYAMFAMENINLFLVQPFSVPHIILPLGISFFTFLQVAYLVDAHKGKASHHTLVEYMAFVTFFPHLIAGPILNHKTIIPQFHALPLSRYDWGRAAMGLSLFAIGLFKKVVLADEFSKPATEVFAMAAKGTGLSFADGWTGALGYTLQLYFDFSAYSDMAIGLGLLFGIRLPTNFLSPYKATNIIDFWRSWHITLSNFLRDYLYIPLGGNRLGNVRRYVNLGITMLLGGIWHGAGWTFVVWGALHGAYLIINHLWRQIIKPRMHLSLPPFIGRSIGWIITMLAVIVAWVFFRSSDIDDALRILSAMTGQGQGAITAPKDIWLLIGGFAFVLLAPNAMQIISHAENGDERKWYSWQPTVKWMAITVLLLAVSIYMVVFMANRVSEFIYFQF